MRNARRYLGFALLTIPFAAVCFGGCFQPKDDKKNEPTIIDGDVEAGAFYTFVVRLPGCSGTLISSRHVLTAGHCVCNTHAVANEPGVVRQYDATDCDAAVSVTVVDASGNDVEQLTSSNVRVHPDFVIKLDASNFITDQLADIAVLELPTPVPLQYGFVPHTHEAPAVGSGVTLVGFGKSGCDSMDFGTRRAGNNEVSTINTDLINITEGNGSLTSKGDSGGALLATIGGQLRIAGVASSAACGASSSFTNVATYAPWIDGIISATQGAFCGNNTCDAGESAATCCTDCGCPMPQSCTKNQCQLADACNGIPDGTYCGSALPAYQGASDDLVTCAVGAISTTSSCAAGCTIQTGNDACQASSGAGGNVTCNNGVREGTEECDKFDLGGNSCSTLGYSGGSLSCSGTCTYDKSKCCQNSCTPGPAGNCAGNILQTCSDIDGNGCFEWADSMTCPFGCANGACQNCTDSYSIPSYVCNSMTPASGGGAGGGEIFKICGTTDSATGNVTIKVSKWDGSSFGNRPYQVRVSAAGDPACGPSTNYFNASASNPSGIGSSMLTFNFQSTWQAGQTEKRYCVTASTQSSDAGYNANDPLQKSWWYSQKISLVKSCQ